MMLKSIFIITIAVICLGLIGLSPIVYAEEYAADTSFVTEQSFAENVKFGAGASFVSGQTFPAGTFFSGAQEFTGSKVYQFTGNGIIFGDGSGIVFEVGRTFGTNCDFSGGLVTNGPDSGTITATNTYGQGCMFTDEQPFTGTQNFAKYNHFGDNTDFTETSQTFKEGMTFGPGSIFKTNQVLPVGTIPSHGVVMNAVTCSDTACVPDPADIIAPGEKYGAGIDPVPTKAYVSSKDKTFEVEGLGLTMTFDTVSTNGDIKADLVNPANVAGSTLSGNTLTATGLGPIVGNVIELSADTATITGNIVVTLPYQDSEVDNENNLTMYHYVNSEWIEEQNCTTDTTANTVTCTVSSLSPFGIGGKNNNSTSGGSDRCSSSHEFGKNKSLKVSQVSYDIESFELIVHAYSTCGSIIPKVFTSNNISILGLSVNQPLLDDLIVIYSTHLEESVERFKITIGNDRNSFTEVFYIYDKSIIKKYGGDTGYTSNQTTALSELSVNVLPPTIEESISVDNEKLVEEKIPSIEYTPEPIAEESIEYTPEPIAEESVCGVGAESVDGICKIIKSDESPACFLFWCR